MPKSKDNHKKKTYSFRVEPELMDDVKQAADALGITVTEFIKQALNLRLNQ